MTKSQLITHSAATACADLCGMRCMSIPMVTNKVKLCVVCVTACS